MNDDHIPVPSGHAPRIEVHYEPQALTDMYVCERDNDDAWISMNVESTMEVER